MYSFCADLTGAEASGLALRTVKSFPGSPHRLMYFQFEQKEATRNKGQFERAVSRIAQSIRTARASVYSGGQILSNHTVECRKTVIGDSTRSFIAQRQRLAA